MIIKCKYCQIELTENLVEVQGTVRLNEIDGSDLIPKGQFLVSNGGYYTGTENKIIINIKDLKNSKNHDDIRRLNGCCGLDGTDGLNKLCLNGHEIGTEKSDCWMAHAIVLDNDKIVCA
ncbi:MAG: hypothetical protein C0490_05220 [Marivirga sp.]|nr:hypothetical protein [Marivirga sp.]